MSDTPIHNLASLSNALQEAHSHADPTMRQQALKRLAIQRRDMDDMQGFETVCAELLNDSLQPGTRKQSTVSFSPAFRAMYSQNPQVLVCYEKHGKSFIALRTPDEYAAAHLSIVHERLNDGGTQGSYWYADANIPEGQQPDAMLAAYLISIGDGFTSVAFESPRDTFRRIRHSPEAEVLGKASTSMLWSALKDAVLERNDNKAAFLASCISKDWPRDCSDTVGVTLLLKQTGMDGDKFPLSRYFQQNSTIAPADRARQILALATDRSTFRMAGRVAAEFLALRRDHEYERVEVEAVEIPRFPIPVAPEYSEQSEHASGR